MGGLLIFVLIIIIFLVISIVLLKGKGSFLIAGYNTASKEEKEKYDEKKLCESMGVFMLFVTVLISILGFFCFLVEAGRMKESTLGPIALIFAVLIIAAVVIEITYSNKKCLKNS